MVSIILTVFNRLKLTEQTLRSLYDHTNRDDFTLTVVDDASDDFRVRRLLERECSRSNATLLRIEKSDHVLSRAKNIGVAWSRQTFGEPDWLYLSDNDVYFTADWLTKLTEVASENLFSLWGGQAHPYHRPIVEATFHFSEHDCLAGTSWLIRPYTWDTYGPLARDTRAGVGQSEDYEFTQRLRAKGGRIAVIHPYVVIDCGWTNSDGKPAPGYELRVPVEGVYHE